MPGVARKCVARVFRVPPSAVRSQRLAVNGCPAFFGGNLESAAFALTGHLPVEVESWRRIWRVCCDHTTVGPNLMLTNVAIGPQE